MFWNIEDTKIVSAIDIFLLTGCIISYNYADESLPTKMILESGII